ncbi:MAG: hypothetical protein M3442_21530, partial [Chloroflexota bacterium]|nr:hypothetical protein [Chloroflexota bacterium]
MLAAGAVRLRPRLAALVLALAVLDSFVPTAFSLATRALIAALPEVIASGAGGAGAGGRSVGPVLLLGGLFALQQVV